MWFGNTGFGLRKGGKKTGSQALVSGQQQVGSHGPEKVGSNTGGELFPSCVGEKEAGRPEISAGRPLHGAASQNMHVYMEDGLASLRSAIEDQAEVLGSVLFSYGSPAAQHSAHELLIFTPHSGRILNMLFGNDQKVDGGLGRDVTKGKYFIVFVEFVCGDIPCSYLAKEAVRFHGHPFQALVKESANSFTMASRPASLR